ncbi:hypothetical protein HPB51_013692 [Rhipicephalus microplus]|uniref:Uncharacterized protein n=1 Tax=Rhipicephalus microplus TaxID=6941 RepID=A0A9J6F4K6_RHIMP|nr:hypothetical protein HPB51_013692 [Rhipicephalus microplus]
MCGFLKADELDRYLDAEFQDRADLTEGAKLQLILAEEDRIRQVIAAYQRMEDLKPVLDSTHIKDVFEFKVAASEQADEQTRNLHHLLATYNDLVNTISKQLLLWDSILTSKLEQQNTKTVPSD